MPNFNFIPLEKADLAKRQVWGHAAIEQPDQGQPPEIMDYVKSKPNFLKWSEKMQKDSQGKSLGNVRAMHGGQLLAVGRIIHLEARDVEKSIYVGAEVVDDAAWEKIQKGVYTGFSIGGSYGARWPDPLIKGAFRYEAKPTELSLVDSPCIPDAVFEFIKMDGASELRKFATADPQTQKDNMDNKDQTPDQPKNDQPAPDAQAPAAAENESTEPQEPNSTADSAATGAADETSVMDADDVQSIVMDLLTRLGLVQASGAQPMSMAVRLDELHKSLSGFSKELENRLQLSDLNKSMDAQKVVLEGQINELKKTLSSDLGKIAYAVEALEKRGGAGPVIRDLGEISPQAMADLQKSTVMKEMLKTTTDVNVRQSLETEITRLEIKAVQQSKPTK